MLTCVVCKTPTDSPNRGSGWHVRHLVALGDGPDGHGHEVALRAGDHVDVRDAVRVPIVHRVLAHCIIAHQLTLMSNLVILRLISPRKEHASMVRLPILQKLPSWLTYTYTN